jgi:hypothetical protein
MMLVSLVLKLLVSSRPLKLEGVLCIYVLLSHEGQAENHLYVFSDDLNTCLTFIVSFSWSFICVLFHVITWLLSFFYQDYIFHAHWRGSNSAMPMSKGFRSRKRIGRLANSTASDRNRGCTRIYPGLAPRRVKTYILLVWSCIASICGAVTKVRRCNLAEVEGDGVASLCEFVLKPMWIRPSRGAPLVALYMQPVRVYR